MPQNIYEDYIVLEALSTLITELPQSKTQIDFKEYTNTTGEILNTFLVNYIKNSLYKLKRYPVQDGSHNYSKENTDEIIEKSRTISSTAVINSFIRFFRGESTREDLSFMIKHLSLHSISILKETIP